jgi:hypothetical protein
VNDENVDLASRELVMGDEPAQRWSNGVMEQWSNGVTIPHLNLFLRERKRIDGFQALPSVGGSHHAHGKRPAKILKTLGRCCKISVTA